MAKIAVSVRLDENTQAMDLQSKAVLELETVLPWGEIADAVYEATFKPYFSNQEVVVSFVEAPEIRELNFMYRNIDSATDVLSFNAIGNLSTDLQKFEDLSDDPEADPEDASVGDVIICLTKAQSQAQEAGHSLKREIAFLFIHGLLHLLGYDHETPDEEAEMFGLQDKILAGLDLNSEPCAV